MINQENINKIYEAVINNIPLTTKELNSYGLNSKDLKKLREQQIIKNIKRGEYELVSIEDLYNYGVSLLSQGESTLAFFCFGRCIDLVPNHLPSHYQILYFHLQREEYQQVYKTLDKLQEIIDFKSSNNINLYLFLLSYITELPSIYQEQVLSMTKDNLTLKTEDKNLEKIITTNIYKAKLSTARFYLNILNSNEQSIGIERTLVNELLTQAIDAKKNLSENLLALAKEERYRDIETLLDNKIKTRKCKLSDEYSLLLSRVIQKMIRTKEIPETLNPNSNTNNMYKAIDENNFELALKLNDEFLKRLNQNNNTLFSILLRKVNELISQIKTSEVTKENINQENIITKEIITKPEIPININFTDLLLELFHHNIEKFSELLNQYLKQIGKQEYQYLIINLTKLSILEGDNSYLEPILTLTELEKNTFNFDITKYIQDLYIYISQNKIQQAKIYLEIISKYYQGSPNLIDNLTQILDSKTPNAETSPIVETEQDEPVSLNQKNTPDNDQDLEEARALINETVSKMQKNGEIITILKDIPYEKRRQIHSLIKEIPELASFSVGEEPKTVVLRTLDLNQERLYFNQYLDIMFKSYDNQEYQLTIDSGTKLLQNRNFSPMKYKNPKKFLDVLGLSHHRLNNHEEAIKYLTIVTKLNEEQSEKNPCYDHTILISKLQSSLHSSNDLNSLKTTEFQTIIPEPIEEFSPVEVIEETIQPVKTELLENDSFAAEEPKEDITPVTENEPKSNEEPIVHIENSQPTEEINTPTSPKKEQPSETKLIQTQQEPTIDIEKIEEIAYYISATKMSFDYAVNEYNLNETQIQLIKLVYARDYYIEGIMSEGDKLLKQVEKVRNKTKQVRDLLSEIKRDRLFYKNRNELKQKRRTIIIQKH